MSRNCDVVLLTVTPVCTAQSQTVCACLCIAGDCRLKSWKPG